MNIMKKIQEKQADVGGCTQVTIAFLGDSVTQGCFDAYWQEDSIMTVFDQTQGYHQKLAKLLAMLYPSVPVTIINAGISGGDAVHGLQRLERDVLRHEPDMVVVCFGLNDAFLGLEGLTRYTDALHEIFQKLRAQNIETVFMTPNMMATEISCHLQDPRIWEIAANISCVQNSGTLDAYVAAAISVCREHNIRVCDCYAKWKTLAQNGVKITDLLSNKINHPTSQMHWLFAASLLEVMMKA